MNRVKVSYVAHDRVGHVCAVMGALICVYIQLYCGEADSAPGDYCIYDDDCDEGEFCSPWDHVCKPIERACVDIGQLGKRPCEPYEVCCEGYGGLAYCEHYCDALAVGCFNKVCAFSVSQLTWCENANELIDRWYRDCLPDDPGAPVSPNGPPPSDYPPGPGAEKLDHGQGLDPKNIPPGPGANNIARPPTPNAGLIAGRVPTPNPRDIAHRAPTPDPCEIAGRVNQGPNRDRFDGTMPHVKMPPVAGSKNPTSIGEPISVTRGSFTISEDDLIIDGITPIRIGRSFNSEVEFEGELGFSWRPSSFPYLDTSLIQEGLIMAPDRDGSVMIYANDTWPECETNDDCPDDEYCTGLKFCESLYGFFDCLKKSDCADDEYCTEDGKCKQMRGDICECLTADDCASEEYCNEHGECENMLGGLCECLTNDDCREGKYCDEYGVCEEMVGNICDCLKCEDCSLDEYCNEDGECRSLYDIYECLNSSDCRDGEYCNEAGACASLLDIYECLTPTDCQWPDEYCKATGECVPLYEVYDCVESKDCGPTEYCTDYGYCADLHDKYQCLNDLECGGGRHYCNARGYCREYECLTHAECRQKCLGCYCGYYYKCLYYGI